MSIDAAARRPRSAASSRSPSPKCRLSPVASRPSAPYTRSRPASGTARNERGSAARSSARCSSSRADSTSTSSVISGRAGARRTRSPARPPGRQADSGWTPPRPSAPALDPGARRSAFAGRRVGVDHPDDAPVGERRDGEPGDLHEDRLVVEGRRQTALASARKRRRRAATVRSVTSRKKLTA